MKKTLAVLTSFLLLIVLSSCAYTPENSIRYTELTERELDLVTPFSTDFVSYEYNLNRKYKMVRLFGERYINGQKTDDTFFDFTHTLSEGKGILDFSILIDDENDIMSYTSSTDSAHYEVFYDKPDIGVDAFSLGALQKDIINLNKTDEFVVYFIGFRDTNNPIYDPEVSWFTNQEKFQKELKNYNQIEIIKAKFQ